MKKQFGKIHIRKGTVSSGNKITVRGCGVMFGINKTKDMNK